MIKYWPSPSRAATLVILQLCPVANTQKISWMVEYGRGEGSCSRKPSRMGTISSICCKFQSQVYFLCHRTHFPLIFSFFRIKFVIPNLEYLFLWNTLYVYCPLQNIFCAMIRLIHKQYLAAKISRCCLIRSIVRIWPLVIFGCFQNWRNSWESGHFPQMRTFSWPATRYLT